jgi:hypothetical protein
MVRSERFGWAPMSAKGETAEEFQVDHFRKVGLSFRQLVQRIAGRREFQGMRKDLSGDRFERRKLEFASTLDGIATRGMIRGQPLACQLPFCHPMQLAIQGAEQYIGRGIVAFNDFDNGRNCQPHPVSSFDATPGAAGKPTRDLKNDLIRSERSDISLCIALIDPEVKNSNSYRLVCVAVPQELTNKVTVSGAA